MAKRKSGDAAEIKPDLTPLIDVCFQLITFFVMVMNIATDETAQKVKLPVAQTAPVTQDDQIPDALNINVDKNSVLWGWGLQIPLDKESGIQTFTKKLKLEADLQKLRMRQEGKDWKKGGLSTTLIVRVDQDVPYEIFRKVMDVARSQGFVKYQIKARETAED